VNLQHLCESAVIVGRSFDLTGCDYGPHKRSQRFLGVQPYYHFLAGFVRHLNLRKILEIGTSYGGSMMAMYRGCKLEEPGVELVTIDKIDMAGAGLIRLGRVERICGNSLAPDTLAKAKAQLSTPIDLLYIDSKHSYDHTLQNIASYAGHFHPDFVILDDIHLNEEMEALWGEMQGRYGHLAYDASDLAERPTGFGVFAYAAAKAPASPERAQWPASNFRSCETDGGRSRGGALWAV
jgi:hypothetical protein